MKTPPPAEDHPSPSALIRTEPRDKRFVLFLGLVLAALTLGLKSELLAPNQVWAAAALIAFLAVPLTYAYLSTAAARPSLEHFVPLALGALVVAGLAQMIQLWWQFGIVALLFGLGFFVTAQLDYVTLVDHQKPGHLVVEEASLALALSAGYLVVLSLHFPLPAQLGLIFLIALLGAFRSFRVHGRPLTPRRALLFSVFVAQLVTFFAWAMTVYLVFNQGVFAVMLFLLWYVNRGIIRHTVDETLSKNVLVEYLLFVLLIGYLFFVSYQIR